MSLQELVQNYGYLAIFIGTFLEGETILILGGLAASSGYLELPWVMVSAGVGSLLGDQVYFLVGRRYGNAILARWPKWQKRVARANELLERYHEIAILTFRFFYGLRNVASFAFGVTRVPFIRFALLNAVGAVIWSVVGATTGYLFGNIVERVLGDVHKYEILVFGGLLFLWGGFWLVRRILRKRRERAQADMVIGAPPIN